MKYVLEKAYKPKTTPAWWFCSGSAFHQATERYDLAWWEATDGGCDPNGLPPSLALLDWLNDELDKEISEAEKQEPDRSLWLRGGRKSVKYPEKEVEDFYRDAFVDWSANYYHHRATSGERIYDHNGQPAVELVVTAEFGGVVVKGAIDQLVVAPTGELGVCDKKTGSSNGNPLQQELYAVMAEIALGVKPTYGIFYNPRKTQQEPAFAITHGPAYFESQFAAFDAQRRSGHVLFNLRPDCSRCGVRAVCPAYSPGSPDAITL